VAEGQGDEVDNRPERKSADVGLREVWLRPSMDTSNDDLVRDFFRPLLERSISYCRGVGYFTSGWLRENAVGLTAFAQHGGHARMIVSPILEESDWDAMRSGAAARTNPALYAELEQAAEHLCLELSENHRNALAWLIADEVIDFRLAFPRDRLTGEFHDKFGIFEDAFGNAVSFSGSYNETAHGLQNYESIKIFTSWSPAAETWVDEDQARFERLWENDDPNVEVVPFPEAARRKITSYRTKDRPYQLPSKAQEHGPRPAVPPHLALRGYQEQAVRAWFASGGRGILSMATGTGKTATALALVVTLFNALAESGKTLSVVVVCPYKHLVDQWAAVAREFGIVARRCYENSAEWKRRINDDLAGLPFRDEGVLLLITTNATLRGRPFQRLLSALAQPILLVGDEVHNLGASNLRSALPAGAAFRLGLSATPERYCDEEGSRYITSYFGETVFDYPLEQAIEEGYLTEYEYYPLLVPLTPHEDEEYLELSSEIGRLAAIAGDDASESEPLKKLLFRRARLIASAEKKLPILERQVRELMPISHCLFYCGDGRVDEPTAEAEIRQIDAVTKLLGRGLGLRVDQYTAETSGGERQRIAGQLAAGTLDGLVAIRCLDEGVDIPEVRNAFILASSTNPRQYVQRRGRVLRRATGKRRARIWDFVVRPPLVSAQSGEFEAERELVRTELTRALSFAELAVNGPQARATLAELRRTYNLMDL